MRIHSYVGLAFAYVGYAVRQAEMAKAAARLARMARTARSFDLSDTVTDERVQADGGAS